MMRVFAVRVQKNCFAFCRVMGVYLGESIYDDILSTLREGDDIQDACHHWSSLIVSRLQELFLENGDQRDAITKYGRSAHGWYQAGCEVVFLKFTPQTVEYSQLGTIHVFARHNETLRLTVPVHNVAEESFANSIEESCIRPFADRSQTEIANQLLYASPEIVPQLASMDRSDFISAIGHCPTRSVGFFPEVVNGRVAYSNKGVLPACGTCDVSTDDNIVVYFPLASETIPYERSRAQAACASRLTNKSKRIELEDYLSFEDSSCVEIVRNSIGGDSTILLKLHE